MTPRRWVALGSVLFVISVMLIPTIGAWYEQEQRLGELRAQVAAQEADVEALTRERDLWESDAYVEAQARERLKFVKVGEKSYTVIDGEPDTPPVDAKSGTIQAEDGLPWYTQLGSSVQAADDPYAAP